MMTNPTRLILFALVGAAVSCATSERVGGAEVEFDIPELTFSIVADPENGRWRTEPPQGIPNVICRGAGALTDDCCGPPGATAGVDCQAYPLTCDAADWCALEFEYDHHVSVDLGSAVPTLHGRRGWVLASAELAAFTTRVDLQGLPIESAALYVAPQGVISSHAPTSRFLGAIPSVPNNSTVVLDDDARRTLSTYLTDFNTPFTLILAAKVAIESSHPGIAERTWVLGTTGTFTVDGRVYASY